MKHRVVRVASAGMRAGSWRHKGLRAGDGFRSIVESVVLVGLLLGVIVAVMAGSGLALFCVVAATWVALAAVVGLRGVLDAGCVFMLVTVGIVLVVDLVQRGPGSLLH